MRRRLVCLLALVVGWLGLAAPAAATATVTNAPASVTLDEYRDRLQVLVNHVEAARQAASGEAARPGQVARELAAARTLAGGPWQVQTPGGTVTADLRRLAGLLERAGAAAGGDRLDQALVLAREHLQAAEATPEPGVAEAGARERLEQALAAMAGRRRWQERLEDAWLGLVNWVRRLIFGEPDTASAPTTPTEGLPWQRWAGLAVGAVGLALLGRSLWRTLAGYGGGAAVMARTGSGAGPPRAATPEEQWQAARALALAGDHLEALRTGYLALLLHLDRQGLVRYQPAQTNWEHVRQLRRRHPPLARELDELTVLVEERLYSGQGATAGDFARGAEVISALWQEGMRLSKSSGPTTGASSSVPSS